MIPKFYKRLALGMSFRRLLKQFPNTSFKDFFTQIGIGIVMAILFVVTILSIALVWAGVLLYSAFQWLVTHDGYTHNKCKCGCGGNTNKPLDPKLEEEFDRVFSKKPFPKPYSPTDNPLYQLEQNYAEWKAKLPPFDREKVFKAVDESNVRMSKMTRKERHNLRGEKGRFIKRSQAETPITRYGVPTSERFGNQ
jgi:hypothetical protein